jgi:hypothetical protein
VAPSFERSEDFAFDKAAGQACSFLTKSCRCAIHAERALRGLPGCVVYDCHGAGQRVTRAFAARPDEDGERDRAFLRVRPPHELMWLVQEALAICPKSDGALCTELEHSFLELDALAQRALHEELESAPEERKARVLLRRLGTALGGRRRLRVLAAG